MFELTLVETFDAAHWLPFHPGKCRNLHGHTWKVEVKIKSRGLRHTGMVMDFGDIKDIIKRYDHQCLNELMAIGTFDGTKLPPTAEHLAVALYDEIHKVTGPNLSVRVKVWESPDSCVEFWSEEDVIS